MRIGILGGREFPTPLTGPIAYALGREIALRGCILVTGGARGSGGEACRGAHEALVELGIDPAQRIISYVPEGKTPEHDYGRCEHRGFTWKDRRGLLVLEADFFFVVGGSEGTLDEVNAAHRKCVPVLPVPESGGVAAGLWAQLTSIALSAERDVLAGYVAEKGAFDMLARRLVGDAAAYAAGRSGRAALLRGLLVRFHAGSGVCCDVSDQRDEETAT